MKICFITMDLFSYGGVQRVLSKLLSELNLKKDIVVNIIMPINPSGQNSFGLDESIRIIDYHDFKLNDRTLRGFICKVIRRINKDTGFLENRVGRRVCDKVYFPGSEKDKLIQFINSEGYDLVVGVGDLFAILLGTISDRLNCKCIGWMHSTFDSYFREKHDQCYGMFEYAKTQFHKLDYVMALTDKDVDDFKKEFGVKAVKLQNPVNYYCEKPNGDNKSPIIFVGRMIKNHKGLDYLVEIMDLYHRTEPKRRFIVLGDGPDKAWFDEEVRKRNLAAVVDSPGLVSNVDEYLQRSSLFIHTSRWEGFGVVIVEAMMYGLPVIAFHNNGPDEIISDGKDGFLVERFDCAKYAQKIREVLIDDNLYARMSENAHNKAIQFTPDRITENLIHILRQ